MRSIMDSVTDDVSMETGTLVWMTTRGSEPCTLP